MQEHHGWKNETLKSDRSIQLINTLGPRWNDHHFADIFEFISFEWKKLLYSDLNKKSWIAPKFIWKDPIDNKSALPMLTYCQLDPFNQFTSDDELAPYLN